MTQLPINAAPVAKMTTKTPTINTLKPPAQVAKISAMTHAPSHQR
jgi:hypothetical protein